MSQASHIIRPGDVFRTLVAHPWRWGVPLAAMTLLGALYAMVRPVSWEVTQALIVRDEAVHNAARPGRFTHVDEMKTAQETVLELVKSRNVLTSALQAIGPPDDYQSAQPWPSPLAVESLQQSIKLAPPKGAEFGKTEVFYLKVSAPQRQRAVDLASAICRQLETQLEDLRVKKYQSVINELTNTVALDQADLDESTAALGSVERQAGRDLAELRTLNESPSSDSALRRMANEIETELRTYHALVSSNQELLKLLESAKENSGRLLASPSRLLEVQPALRRLKEGLVDAQLRTAQLQGTMSDSHPAVQAAFVSEQEIGAHLHDEIEIAITGLDVDLRLANQRVEMLEEQRQTVQGRLTQLAEMRAEYSNLVNAAKHRNEILKTAQQELSEARASQAAAHTSNLITLVDGPDPGTKPAGPGTLTILLGGVMGGLLTGLGVVFLTVQPAPVAGRQEAVAAPLNLSAPVAATAAVGNRSGREPVELAAPWPRPAQPVVAEGGRTVAPGSLSLKQALERVGVQSV